MQADCLSEKSAETPLIDLTSDHSMRIAVARSALLPLLAALPGLAAPGTLKPAAVASRDDGDIKLFIDVGTDTTVIINGVSKSSTSVDDTELFDLGPGPFNALGMLVESRLDPGDPGSMYNYTVSLSSASTPVFLYQSVAENCSAT